MNLPNGERAIVERKKIALYLLNGDHPDNGGKASFFVGLGFSVERWRVLADAFRQLAVTAEVAQAIESRYGRKYVLDGDLLAPTGIKSRRVRSIWIIERGLESPRLVTAYPLD